MLKVLSVKLIKGQTFKSLSSKDTVRFSVKSLGAAYLSELVKTFESMLFPFRHGI